MMVYRGLKSAIPRSSQHDQYMIKRELTIFLIVGLLTVGIDFSVYHLLLDTNFASINIAKGFSFISGTIFSYFANRFWTFSARVVRAGSVLRFILIYAIGLSSNIMVNYFCIRLLSNRATFIDSQLAIHLSFLIATCLSATLNFLGMKFFVFSTRSIPPSTLHI